MLIEDSHSVFECHSKIRVETYLDCMLELHTIYSVNFKNLKLHMVIEIWCPLEDLIGNPV